jgi:membrane protein/epoxyqueuosine reductase
VKARKGALARIATIVSTLFSRDIAVLTNAIAFNFLLCLFPLILVVVAVAQHFEGSHATGAVEAVLSELIPFGRDAIRFTLRGLERRARGLEVLSLLAIVFGSSGIFIPVEMALNRAWGTGLPRAFWKSKILAFFMTVLGGALALLSVALTVESRSFHKEHPFLADVGAKGSAALLTYILFFLVYTIVPEVKVGARIALRASFWAGTLWEGAKYAFVARLARMNLQAFYGPLALSVALILWAYLSSLVLVLGALVVHPQGGAPNRVPTRTRMGRPKSPERAA